MISSIVGLIDRHWRVSIECFRVHMPGNNHEPYAYVPSLMLEAMDPDLEGITCETLQHNLFSALII